MIAIPHSPAWWCWKPLTERTQVDTQVRILELFAWITTPLSMLPFSCKAGLILSPPKRPPAANRSLGSILGLDIWEVYRQRGF